MASLKLTHIYKVYENGHKAVNDFNIDITDKEFIVFVGPSGCGKSTTLRMIAGLEKITAGDLFIGDTLVNDMEPKDRDIAMVFQNYALYPHMSVYDNMAFGLRNRHMPEEQIREKVLDAAKILDIEDYLDRKPKAMSGGQRQRVALGRAIVRDPKVFLLDEPLSNLDAKLRAQMRTEITKLHKKLATTFIYVTHDQVEAMTMGTRIVVMKLGYVQQIDTPMNLYNKPYNKFVAGFIGTPQMNFFDVTLNRKEDKVMVKFPDDSSVPLEYGDVCKAHDSYLHGKVPVILGIRPEHISISKANTGLKASVTAVEHLGNESIVYGVLGKASKDFTMKDEGKNVIIKVTGETSIAVGDEINLALDASKLHLFDHETEVTILEDVPHYSSFEASVSGGKIDLFGAKVALPPALATCVGERKKVTVEVPPYAVVKGNTYSLKVHKVEEIGGKLLAHLEFGDRYLFAFVDKDVKAGVKYSFDLLNDKLALKDEETSLHNTFGVTEQLIGSFIKHDIKRNEVEFYYGINGVNVLAPATNGYKINAVEGNNCYKKNYRYVFDRKAVKFVDQGGIPCTVTSILDYGNQKYAILDAGGQVLTVEVPAKFKESEVNIIVDGNDIEVWQQEIDFRIC